jgi:putative ABC transport system ATP-binding protein
MIDQIEKEIKGTDPPVLQLEAVSRVYSDEGVPVRALDEVSLTVQSGEFLCLVGPSGSGKSTLLNIAGGLDRASAGRVILDGTDITAMPEHQLADIRLRRIGFVFQAFNLLPVLSAVENVEFMLQLRGERNVRARAMGILQLLDMSELAHRRPAELSGGQQQRVAIARALVGEPVLLLADEPSANLDSKATGNLLSLLRRLNDERGVSIITATHDPLVMQHAKRTVTLRDGRIVLDSGGR